jgi:hypothetical protein
MVIAKLAEWEIVASEDDLAELVPAYEALMKSQKVLENMLRTRSMGNAMEFPLSEPAVIHDLERYR